MALYKLEDFIPNYQDYFDGDDLLQYDLYSENTKVGSIDNILVDDQGQFRYFVINTGVWIFGKKVLLPVGCARISSIDHRVYADNLTPEQVENLPEYTNEITVDFDHEDRVRKVYRYPSKVAPAGLGVGYAGVDAAPPSPNTPPEVDLSAGYDGYDKDTYSYSLDPDLYNLNEQYHRGLINFQEQIKLAKKR